MVESWKGVKILSTTEESPHLILPRYNLQNSSIYKLSKISKERKKQANRPRSSGRVVRVLNSESTLQPPVLLLSPPCVSYTETTYSI